MDNQLVAVAHNVRLSKWSEIIKDRECSGLAIDEYCRLHELSRNAYYYWLRKCRQKTISECGSMFAELVPPRATCISSDNADAQAVLEINDIRISVYDRTSRELLAMILEVSKNA